MKSLYKQYYDYSREAIEEMQRIRIDCDKKSSVNPHENHKKFKSKKQRKKSKR